MAELSLLVSLQVAGKPSSFAIVPNDVGCYFSFFSFQVF
jgi:hypothetical protein